MSQIETGSINVQTENIFPIIKKFLYSDHEIFLRELISNAVDATQKLKKLSALGDVQGEIGDTNIEVKIDKDAGTLTISDKGIGMTAAEVKKYINQIAFSSAQEFLDKFKQKDATDNTAIIGHFGLGFYSSFMVSDKVEIVTQSYQEGAEAVKWTCDGSPSYTLEPTEKNGRGTDIVLHINADSKEFLEDFRIEGLLNKYCKFLPVPIKFGTTTKTQKVGEGDDAKEETITEDRIINNTVPAWTKSPSELKDEEYLDFYNELYPYSEPPLFWIHLNVDYPFNLTGILYFPKLNNTFEVQKNKIQLYSNQVFVTDAVENIVPDFLMHLHGVIDSPDIPLNVSRSYLQSDPNVKKINSYITKKVADKLEELFKKDRKAFEEKWENIHLFVKYGMISDDKFSEKAKQFCLLENTSKNFFTIEEYQEKIKGNQTDKHGNLVMVYANNAEAQDNFIQPAIAKGYDILLFETIIDHHFINHLESKLEKVSFKRVDADTLDRLVEKEEEAQSVLSKEEVDSVQKLFIDTINTPTVTVMTKALSPDEQPVYITKPEFMRRMKDMAAVSGGGGFGNFPEQLNLVVNTNHELIGKLLGESSYERKTDLVNQLYDLALLSQNMLKGPKLTSFIQRSVGLIK
ncbi:MAG: molecular chaperone HtpG [Chitinophagales bacterium]|nr:molecular chaperone HtpG [Chitinophagales bacterium]